MKQSSGRKGFTLIEMLIVVAVIGILASVVLVGLGPVQRRGRDARRIQDLRQVQTALELYFGKHDAYPATQSWAQLSDLIVADGLGISSVPKDPSAGRTYQYAASADFTSYVLAATLEDPSNPSLRNDVDGVVFGSIDCADDARNGAAYCIQF